MVFGARSRTPEVLLATGFTEFPVRHSQIMIIDKILPTSRAMRVRRSDPTRERTGIGQNRDGGRAGNGGRPGPRLSPALVAVCIFTR